MNTWRFLNGEADGIRVIRRLLDVIAKYYQETPATRQREEKNKWVLLAGEGKERIKAKCSVGKHFCPASACSQTSWSIYGTLGVTQVCRQQLQRLLIFPNSPKETAVLCMCTCFFHRYLIEDFCVLGSFEVYHINFGWGGAHSVPDKASLMIFFFISVPSF